MPIYLVRAKRQVTIYEVTELSVEAETKEEARKLALSQLAGRPWFEDHTSGYSTEEPEIEVLVDGDEKLPEEVK